MQNVVDRGPVRVSALGTPGDDRLGIGRGHAVAATITGRKPCVLPDPASDEPHVESVVTRPTATARCENLISLSFWHEVGLA